MFESHKAGSALADLQALDSDVSRRSLLKYFGLGAAALGTAPLLAACGNGSGAPEGSTKFPMVSFPGDTFLIDAVNEKNKTYAKNKLDVPKFTSPQSLVAAFQLLTAGAVSGFTSDTLLAIASHANSTKGRRPVVVGVLNAETTYGIVVGPKGDWPPESASFEEKMRSLKGKKVGVTAIGSGSDTQLKLALELAGMKYSDVTPLAVGVTNAAIPNLNAGRIDAYVTVQWVAGRFVAKQTKGRLLMDFTDPSTPGGLRDQAVLSLVTREDIAQKQPDVVKNWIKAQFEGNEYMVSNQKEAATILNNNTFDGKAMEIATGYLQHYAADVAPKLQPQFKVEKATMDKMIGIAEKFGSVKPGAVTYEDLVPAFARV